ncbi:fatty acid desaturase [soil metagenome]|jgi:stearoyl-CoA desaturase (delta-9 desaturase)
MSRAQKATNLIAVVLPFLGFVAAVVLLWNSVVGWLDLAILAGMYLATALGVTVGFHRLLTHRSFETARPLRLSLAALGSMSVQGPVIAWVADHRKHHAFADEEGDPHSPHLDPETGFLGSIRGLLHAHVGWLFNTQAKAGARRYARDLLDDPAMRRLSRAFPALALLGLAIPFGLGLAITGTLAGGLTALLWGGLVRVFFVHHVTWSINSICHFFGRRRFDTDDHSTNVAWLALPSLGEAWHHNHHAFPTSAFHGLRRLELDPSGLLIQLLERVGLAWGVVRVPPERQAAKARATVAAQRTSAG